MSSTRASSGKMISKKNECMETRKPFLVEQRRDEAAGCRASFAHRVLSTSHGHPFKKKLSTILCTQRCQVAWPNERGLEECNKVGGQGPENEVFCENAAWTFTYLKELLPYLLRWIFFPMKNGKITKSRTHRFTKGFLKQLFPAAQMPCQIPSPKSQTQFFRLMGHFCSHLLQLLL